MTIDPMDSPRSPRPIEEIDPSAYELDEGANNEKPRTGYVLRGGDAGAERLRLLAQVVWPTTERLLDRVGVAPGMRCLDVGCGIGAVTVELARRVGPSGHVLGIDFDSRSVEIAAQSTGPLGLPVAFRAARAEGLAEPASYDLVYARFVLTHLADPLAALRAMSAAAKPGELVVVEDIEFAAHFACPACPAFERYVSLYQQVVRKSGGDPEIGRRLFSLFLDAGLRDVTVQVEQPAFTQGAGKRMATITLEHIREKAVGAGCATSVEIDALLAELDAFTDDPRTVLSLPRIFQMCGRRPHQPDAPATARVNAGRGNASA